MKKIIILLVGIVGISLIFISSANAANVNGPGLEYNDGYEQGFNDGLDEAFNENNLISNAEKKLKGTTGPGLEYVGLRVMLNKKVNSITLLNLVGYSLKPLNYTSGGYKQGFNIKYEGGSRLIAFDNYYDNFHTLMDFRLDDDRLVEYIDIVLALNNAEIPSYDLDNMLNHMINNLGLYVNNKILGDDAIIKFKEIMEFDLRMILNEEHELILEQAKDAAYQRGINENIETGGFGMILGAAFTGVSTLLSIQLLPNVSIGSIVAIPIVFGVIMFIIGRKKE